MTSDVKGLKGMESLSRANYRSRLARRAIHDLTGDGWSAADLAELLAVTVRTVQRARRDLRRAADAVRDECGSFARELAG